MTSGGGFSPALFDRRVCAFSMQMPDPERDLKCTAAAGHDLQHLMAYEYDAIEDDEQVAGVPLPHSSERP